MMAREDVRTRYAELRAISNKHHNAALQFVSRQSINRNARRSYRRILVMA
jgi:hypothetical protein